MIKSFKLALIAFTSFLFTGCLEINEEIIINKNGSGNLSMKTEMGKELFEMLQAFMPADEMKKSGFGTPKDTVLLMKDIIDTMQTMSADKKAVLRNGSIHLKMNMAEKQLMFNVSFPFQKLSDIGNIYDNLGEAQAGMGNMMNGLGGEAGDGPVRSRENPSNNSFYDYTATKGSISRTLNKEKYAQTVKDGKMEQLKQMGSMGGGMTEMQMNTTIKLPKKAKKLTGAKAVLSADKKTVLVKATLNDMYEHPELYEFSVKY